jgi:iron complex outermembrane receptor protein
LRSNIRTDILFRIGFILGSIQGGIPMRLNTSPITFRVLASLFVGALAGGNAAVAAQAVASSNELEEVVVTAQNRTENVQRVPIAITVVSAEKIAESGFASLNDIQKIAPAVQLINDNNALRVTVRGVGSNTNGETNDTSVVVNVDGEYINRGAVLGTSMFDIERIEVLRGPQGTLYGRNSTGGAINIITRKPGDKLAFNATAGGGNLGAVNLEAGVDVPLGPTASLRFAAIHNDHNGYYSHPALTGPALVRAPAAESGSEKGSAGRVSLRLDPNEALSMNFAVEYSKRDFVNGAADTTSLSVAGNAPTGPGCNAPGFVNIAPLYLNPPNSYAPCIPKGTNFLAAKDPKKPYAQPWYGVGGYEQDSTAVRARVAYEFSPAATLTYVGGYRSGGLTGEQGLPVTYRTITFLNDVTTQSHELRLSGEVGRVNYQAGAFHFQEKLDSEAGFAIDSVAAGQAPGTSQFFLSYFTRKQDSKSDSVFGQLDIGLTDTLRAQVGLRHTSNDRSAVYGNIPPGPPLVGQGIGRKDLIALFGARSQSVLRSDESKTTYLLGLNYTPNDRTLVYGKLSTGFKGGGFDQVGKFNPETNTAIEAGIKKNFGASGQHYVNVSAFTYNYADLQVSALLNPSVGGQTFNAGEASISGLELEGAFRPTQNDSLTATVNYLSAKFDKFLGIYNVYCVPASCTAGVTAVSDLDPSATVLQQPDLAGNAPANSPKIVATLGYDRTFPLTNGGSLKASLFARYKSRYYTDFYNYNDAQQEAYAQTDVSLVYQSASGHYTVQGYVQNVGDYRPLINAYYISAGPSDRIFNFWYGQPRVYGLKVGVNY